MTVSPTLMSPVGTVTSLPSRRTTADSGASASRAVMAPVVLPFGALLQVLTYRHQRQYHARRLEVQVRHTVTFPAASRPISIRLYTSPAAAPSATSESILGAPLNSREKPTVK